MVFERQKAPRRRSRDRYNQHKKIWFFQGKLHREDGPAIEYPNGTKKWYLNGKRHREDGPAVEYPNGTKEWFLNDVEYSEKDWYKQLKPNCELEIDLIFS